MRYARGRTQKGIGEMLYQKLSEFQTEIIKNMNVSLYANLELITSFLHADKIYLIMEGGGEGPKRNLDLLSYSLKERKQISKKIKNNSYFEAVFREKTKRSRLDDGMKSFFIANSIDVDITKKYFLFVDFAIEKRYIFLIERSQDIMVSEEEDLAYYHIIHLFLENNILREKMLWESEHDQLTMLYNQGKYLSRKESEYLNLQSVGVIFFDINNLKVINDCQGHNSGDILIRMMSECILRQTSDSVHGYRIGGDEFLLVDCNDSKEHLDELESKCLEVVKEMNQKNPEVQLSVALGKVYAKDTFDFEKVVALADERMYEMKRKMKED